MSNEMLKRIEQIAGCEVRATEYPGYYISWNGFIYSVARGTIKRMARNSDHTTVIWVNGKTIGVSTPRLVYHAFVGSIPSWSVVRIVDRTKEISPENLAITMSGKGVLLSSDNVLEIRKRYLLGFSRSDLAKHWKASKETISNIVKRDVWAHLPHRCPICDLELPAGRLYCSDDHKKKAQRSRNYRRHRVVRLYRVRVKKGLSLDNLYLRRRDVEAILGISRARVGELVKLGKLSESDLGIPAVEVRAREQQFGRSQKKD